MLLPLHLESAPIIFEHSLNKVKLNIISAFFDSSKKENRILKFTQNYLANSMLAKIKKPPEYIQAFLKIAHIAGLHSDFACGFTHADCLVKDTGRGFDFCQIKSAQR